MYNKQKIPPLLIVRYYLKNGTSLRKTSRKFHIHYQTLYKWVKQYKEGKKEHLLSTYKRPWNRFPLDIEEKIVQLKERNPIITIRKARALLEKDDIYVSVKGIWEVWKRYGYCGFVKKEISMDYTHSIPWTRESKCAYTHAHYLYKKGNVREAAHLLNTIPSLPNNELLLKIPDQYLTLRRKKERIYSLFEQIPFQSFMKYLQSLRKELVDKKLYYSTIRLGLIEMNLLGWKGTPTVNLKRIEALKKLISHQKPFYAGLPSELRFSLLIQEWNTCISLSRVRRATKISHVCARLMRRKKYKSLYLMFNLGVSYMNIGNFPQAEYWLSKIFPKINKEAQRTVGGYLAHICLSMGKYKKATQYLRNYETGSGFSYKWDLAFQSNLALLKGMPYKAISLARKSLSAAKKEGLNNCIYNATFSIACAYSSIGEHTRANQMIKRMFPFLRKHNLNKALSTSEILLGHTEKYEGKEELLPTVKLALLLQQKDYKSALSYAQRKGFLTYLYRYILLSPERVIELLKEGRSPSTLPKSILRLPVFNKEIPVYDIRLLGNLIVYKNQKYIGVKLQPKDTAFLIYLALTAEEPNKTISLKEIHKNFWKNSSNPSRNLSHLLVRIKRAINLPSHLLEISHKKDNFVLINKGIHFITDYGEYIQSLAQAKSLMRAGEWGFAKREFLRAFKLFRGEPFRKMYDDWSDDKRLEVLFSYETEVLSFAKELRKRGRDEETERLLKKAQKIIPNSDEIETEGSKKIIL